MTPDELDDQLRSALGGETSPEQLARLECFWHARSRAERRSRMLRTVAMAAAVLVAATVAWQSTRRADVAVGPPPLEVATADPSRIDGEPVAPRPDPVIESDAPLVDAPLPGREPTDYERLVFAVHTRRPADRTPETRRSDNEKLSQQREAIKQFADRGDRNALPALLQWAENTELRGDALTAIERIAGPDHLAAAAAHARSGAVRTALYQRQLTAGSAASIPDYLALVTDPATRHEALAAARSTAANFPVEPLVRELDSSDKSTRVAAAMVLGNVNGPAVSTALIARVSTTQRAPVEAWVALLACPGPAVDQFLAAATRQPRMLGQVNNARAMWARMVP